MYTEEEVGNGIGVKNVSLAVRTKRAPTTDWKRSCRAKTHAGRGGFLVWLLGAASLPSGR